MNLSKLAFLALALAALPAQAQSTRGGKSEFYLAPVFTDGENYTFEGGSTASTDTGYGLTLGYAFNFDQHKSLGVEFGMGQPGLPRHRAARRGTTTARSTSTAPSRPGRCVSSARTTSCEGNFTPFVTGGLGWTYLDTNIPTGLPQNVCWYYPWYGLLRLVRADGDHDQVQLQRRRRPAPGRRARACSASW